MLKVTGHARLLIRQDCRRNDPAGLSLAIMATVAASTMVLAAAALATGHPGHIPWLGLFCLAGLGFVIDLSRDARRSHILLERRRGCIVRNRRGLLRWTRTAPLAAFGAVHVIDDGSEGHSAWTALLEPLGEGRSFPLGSAADPAEIAALLPRVARTTGLPLSWDAHCFIAATAAGRA